MNIMKPRAAALGFLFGALEAAEGSVRLLAAFLELVYITLLKMASWGFLGPYTGLNRIPPLAYGLWVNTRCSGTVGLAAAWVGKLPGFDLGLLIGAAAAIFITKFIVVNLVPTIDTGNMVMAAAAISFGWRLHMYARAAFYPVTGAFV